MIFINPEIKHPSSYDKLLLHDPAHFDRNDTTRRRVDSHFWRRRQRTSKRQVF